MTAETILSFLWEANVSLACFALLYLTVLRQLTFFQWNRFYLFLMPVVALIIGAVNIEIVELVTSAPEATALQLSDLFPVFSAKQDAEISQAASTGVLPFLTENWTVILLSIVASVSVLVLFQLLFQWVKLRIELKRTSELIPDLHVFKNDRFNTAFVFANRVYIPEAFLSLAPSDLQSVVAHERAHLSLKHGWDNTLMALLKPLFWYNPIYWFALRELKMVHEFQADESCAYARNSADYAELLVRLSAPGLSTTFVQPFSKNLIKKRVKKLNQSKSSIMKKALFVLSIALCSALFYAFSVHQVTKVVSKDAAVKTTQRTFSIPIDPGAVTRFVPFGMRQNPFSETREMHTGVDFSAPQGTAIFAAADGIVTLSEARKNGYGNILEITHDNGLKTRYAHLETFKVFNGDVVSQGDVIALCGSTGQSTGPHLHFEVLENGVALNPEDFITITDYSWEDEASLKKAEMTIVIDAGHGGEDSGIRESELEEKALTLAYAKRLHELLETESFNVKMTRTGDESMALLDRAEMTSEKTVFISLHFNQAKSESVSGVELYVPTEKGARKTQSQKIANAVNAQLAKSEIDSRGLKEANFTVLKNTAGPAVLIELGFLSSPTERAKILSEDYKEKLLNSIVEGIGLYAQ